MKNKKRIVFYWVVLFVFGHTVTAQFTIPFQDPKTPEVTSFERYGNVPISEYSGRPNISIPLYRVEHGDISIPLNLTYNSNGIRVDEEASEVGLGWYFGMGMVTQTINGKDDLRENHEFRLPDYFDTPYAQYVVDTNPGWYEYWDFPDIMKALDVFHPDRVLTSPSTPTNDTYSMVRARSDGIFYTSEGVVFPYDGQLTLFDDRDLNLDHWSAGYDVERDIFQANFFGHSIAFYRTDNGAFGTYRVMNGEKYGISLTTQETANALEQHWKIVAPNGITYFFQEELISRTLPNNPGGSRTTVIDKANTYSSGVITSTQLPKFNNNVLAQYVRSWKITKIVDTKGNEVTFHYTPLSNLESESSSHGKSEFVDLNFSVMGRTATSSMHFDGPLMEPGTGYSQNGLTIFVKRDHSRHTTERSNLSEIRFSNAKLVFNNTSRVDIPGATKISSIDLFEGTSLVKEVDFRYSYFNPNHSEATQKRLKLDEVQVEDKIHTFQYNGSTLPNKNSNAFDYWGFYNGMPNTTDINDPFRLFENSGHIPSWGVKQLISQINGKANRSAHPDHCKAGILEKITYPTLGSTEIIYELNEFDNIFFPNHDNKLNFNGSTYATDYVQPTSKGYGLRIKEIINNDGNGIATKLTYTYHGGKHLIPYISYNQNNFREVRFSVGVDGGGQYADKTTYYGPCVSSNFSNSYQSGLWGNGQGVGYDRVDIEAIDHATGNPNGKTSRFYTNVPDSDARSKFGLGGGLHASYNDLFGYPIRNTNEDNGLVWKEVLFDNTNDTIQKTEYEYNSIVPEETHYPGNLSSYNYNVKVVSIGAWGYAQGCTSQVVNDCSSPPTLSRHNEYLFFYYPLKQTKTLLKEKTITDYLEDGTVSIREAHFYDDAYREERQYMVNLAEGYDTRVETQTVFQESTHFPYPYRNLFLPKEVTSYKGDKVVGHDEYSYRYPATYTNYTQLKDKISCKEDPATSGLSTSGCQKIHYQTFDGKGNLLEYNIASGISHTILWGHDRRYPVAKIEGASFPGVASVLGLSTSTLQLNGLVNLSLLDNIRTDLQNALVTTYTYDPLVGVTSMTDPRGYTTYYEYDEHNRLKFIKDADNNLIEEYKYNYKNQ